MATPSSVPVHGPRLVVAGVTFHVERLQVVTRALAAAGGQLRQEGTSELHAIGGIVERAAEVNAKAVLNRPKTRDWSTMRTGVTPAVVYVVPQNKGTRGRGPRHRPNFAPLLLNRAMRPALQRNRPEALRRYRALTARVCRAFNG